MAGVLAEMAQLIEELEPARSIPARGSRPRPNRWGRAIPVAPTVLLIVSGAILRLLSVTGAYGSIDSDQAMAGLMARHIWHGDFGAFFWGHAYGGSADAFLLSPFVAIAPGSPLAIRASALIESVAIALVIWRVLLRSLKPRTAAFAAAAAFAYPAYSAAFSVKAELFYNPIVLLGVGLLLLTLCHAEHPDDWRNPVGWGLLAGVGWWQGPTISIFILASLAWIVWSARSLLRVRTLVLCVPPFLLGAAPWLYFNLRLRGFPSLHNPPRDGTVMQHVTTFLTGGIPSIFGLRIVPNGEVWLVPVAFGVALTVLLALILLLRSWALLRSSSPLPLAIFVGAVIIVFTIPWSNIVANGRYFYYIAPLVTAVVVSGFKSVKWQALVAVVILVGGLACFDKAGLFRPGVVRTVTSVGTGANRNDQLLVRDLERWGTTRLYADYWVAYKDDYLSDERLTISAFYFDHHHGYTKLIEHSASASYLLARVSPAVRWLEVRFHAMQVPYVIHSAEGFVVLTPRRNLNPAQLGLPRAWLS